jgi:hypothetical protein
MKIARRLHRRLAHVIDLIMERDETLRLIRLRHAEASGERLRDVGVESAAFIDGDQGGIEFHSALVRERKKIGARDRDARRALAVLEDFKALGAHHFRRPILHRHQNMAGDAGSSDVGEDDPLARRQDVGRPALRPPPAPPPAAHPPAGFSKLIDRLSSDGSTQEGTDVPA